ncbi:MAG: HlyC/CorC family transporter [Chloroflexi bacterium]|nr:HlyC/CorC family transporter [Chloroflexota bacterium]
MLEFLIILAFIFLNGLFAMSEIAVVSARKVRLHQRAREGDRRAQAALDLANAPGPFLSTVQVGITLIGILAGAFGGATIAERLESYLSHFPLLGRYAEALGVGVVVVVITYLSLVIGELAPKQIALNNAERVAARVAPTMQRLARLASPLVRLLSLSTDLLLRLVGVKLKPEPAVTEEEIKLLIGQGTQAGVFERIEQEMVEKVFRLGDRKVESLITPRAEVRWLDVNATPEEMARVIVESGYDQYPVAEGSLDAVLGVAYASDLLAQFLEGRPLDVRAVLQPALFVPETTPIFRALERFKEMGTSMAFTINEYGGVDGLVTSKDLLEAIVGEIPNADDPYDPDIVVRADGSWLLDGMLSADDLLELLSLRGLPGLEHGHYQTLGGFVMDILGKVPHAGDHYLWGGYRFEVMDMDGNRVDKVLVAKLPPVLRPGEGRHSADGESPS